MKKKLTGFFATATLILVASSISIKAQEFSRVFTPFNEVVYYDGYNETVVDADLDDGFLRHRNSLYAKKLTDEHLDWFGKDVNLEIIIGAMCDNYDRIGNLNLAFVPKGSETYSTEEVSRIELARFITPFMDKNKMPDEVCYKYDGASMSYIFRDQNLRDKYDFWLELEVFGVPYAAQGQVIGCRKREDVFRGTVRFICNDDPAESEKNQVLVPIVMKKPEYIASNLNNYTEAGTDTIGTCTKTYKFTVPEKVVDSQLVLITSNHGANANGEEYKRRVHLIYVDGELVTSYKPGGKSCEPYRYLNTQSNGIYGTSSRSESSWLSSNWCPGDLIPIRYLNLGEFEAGEHEIMIRVPDAVFAEQQGDIPVSIYFQGVKEGELPAEIDEVSADAQNMKLYQVRNTVYLETEQEIASVSVYTYDGKFVYGMHTDKAEFNLESFEAGVYLVTFFMESGDATTFKAVKN